MDDSCNLLSLTAFQSKYGIKVQPLTFFGITSAVNRLRRSITRTHNKYESFLSKLHNTKKPSRLAYQKLVSKKSEHPISCQEKWKKDTASDINESFNWKTAYQISFKCTKTSTWIQSCQVPLQNNHFSMKTALGLKPDSSANKLQINFCCLTSKYYIWLCHSKEQVPTVGNYLKFLKHIYQMEKNTTAAKRQN